MSAENFKIKIFIEANPVLLEELFNAWSRVERIAIQGPPQIQYSPALQKFILSTTYLEMEYIDVKRETDEPSEDRGSGFEGGD